MAERINSHVKKCPICQEPFGDVNLFMTHLSKCNISSEEEEDDEDNKDDDDVVRTHLALCLFCIQNAPLRNLALRKKSYTTNLRPNLSTLSRAMFSMP